MSEAWKERFRARTVFWSRPSLLDRRRAIAMSDATGLDQLYAWEPGDGEVRLRQLTDRPGGTAFGYVSGDGRHVFYLDDDAGDELGHFVRVPYEGGEPEDITPGLPSYASDSLQARRGTSGIVFTAASASGHETWLVDSDAAPDERRRLLHRTDGMAEVSGVTVDGALVLIRTNERTGTARFALIAVDTDSAELRAELWDGPQSSIEEVVVSPLEGDRRVACSSDTGGVPRPFVWDPRTGSVAICYSQRSTARSSSGIGLPTAPSCSCATRATRCRLSMSYDSPRIGPAVSTTRLVPTACGAGSVVVRPGR